MPYKDPAAKVANNRRWRERTRERRQDVTELFAPALVALENESVHIVFPEEPHAAGQRLLRTLGVTWSVDLDAPRLAEPVFDPNARGDRSTAHLREGWR